MYYFVYCCQILNCFKLEYVRSALSKYRVGSHVVSVRIHCTEKWRTSFHNDVFRKSK